MKHNPSKPRAKPAASVARRIRPTRGSEYTRTDQEVIDEDLHVTIYKSAASCNWYVQYNHPSEGQRKQSLRTRNKKEAKRRAWEIVLKLRNGDIGSATRRGPRLKEVIDGFLADKRRIGRRETTITEYRRGLEQFCQFVSELGIQRLDQLTPTHMEQYEAQLRETGIALKRETKGRGAPAKKNKSTSVHEKIKLVKSLTKWAVAMRKLRENPISGYQLPADGESENYCFKSAEVRTICQHAEPFFAEVFRFLALTGLRQGELIWLTKKDVNVQRRLVRIRAKSFPKERLRWDPKGDDRVVPLSPPALAIAEKMLATGDGRWLFSAPPAPGVIDDRLRPSRLWAQLKKAKKVAGVERGTLHSYRHFFVSTMANANVSPFKVMKIVGHSSLDIILTYYHIDEDELLGAVDGVDFDVTPSENHGEKNEK
jgi:integrase/recombinase XerD